MIRRFVFAITLLLLGAAPEVALAQSFQTFATWRVTLDFGTNRLEMDVACSRDGSCGGDGPWHVVDGGELNGYARLTFYNDTSVQLAWQVLESEETRGSGRSDLGWPHATTAEGTTILDWSWSAVRTSVQDFTPPTLPPERRQSPQPPPSPPVKSQAAQTREVDWESLPEGAELKTDAKTKLILRFADGSRMDVGPNAHFVKGGSDPSFLGDLVHGAVRFYEDSKKMGVGKAIDRRKFRVTCGARWCGGAVRGTEFVAEVNDDQTATLRVLSGIVDITSDDNTASVEVRAGQEVRLADGWILTGPNPFDPDSVDRWWQEGPSSALVAGILLLVPLYVLPLFLSIMLRVEKWWIVALVLLAGWTIVGWVVAFVLAFTLRRKPGIQAMPFASPT